MVIVVGNGHSNLSSNYDDTVFIVHIVNTLWKVINQTILPPAMDKQ